MVCRWIGQLRPSAFVSTYHTIAAVLFPTMGVIMKTKMNCPFLGALCIESIKTLNLPIHLNEYTFFFPHHNFGLSLYVMAETAVSLSQMNQLH